MRNHLVKAVKSKSNPDEIEWIWINKLRKDQKSGSFPNHVQCKDDLLSKGIAGHDIEYEFPIEYTYNIEGKERNYYFLEYLPSYSSYTKQEIIREIENREGIITSNSLATIGDLTDKKYDTSSQRVIKVSVHRFLKTGFLDEFELHATTQ